MKEENIIKQNMNLNYEILKSDAQNNKYLSAPKMSFALSLLNSANPTIGRYSLTRDLGIA